MIATTPAHGIKPAAAQGDARRATVLWSALALLVCTNGPSTYLALHVFGPGGGGHEWLTLYPFTAVAVAGISLLARQLRGRSWTAVPKPMYAVGAYAAWAVLSGLWSVSSQTTATSSLLDVGIAAFGCWFGWCLSLREQLWSVMLACSTAVGASAVVIYYLPQYGKMLPVTLPDSNWQGIFGNRNSLAPVCVLGLIALAGFVAMRPSIIRSVISLGLAVVHVALLRGSGGVTSLAALGLSMGVAAVVPVIWFLKRKRVPGTLVGGIAVGSLSVATMWGFRHIDTLATMLSKDVTLTGRRPIWRDVRAFISDRPIRGYGYWAFWDRVDLTSASYARLQSAYGSAHNSVLEVLLGLGVVGLTFYLMIVFAAVVGIAMMIWARPSGRSWWWACALTFLVVQNLMESFVLWHSYNWLLFVAAVFVPFNETIDAPSADSAECVEEFWVDKAPVDPRKT